MIGLWMQETSAPGLTAEQAKEVLGSFKDVGSIAYFVGFGLLAIVLAMAPLLGAKGRKRSAVLLAVCSVPFLVLLGIHGRLEKTQSYYNPFPMTENTESLFGFDPYYFETDTVTAPGWQWPLVCLAAFLIPALILWVRANRQPRAPMVWLHVLLVGAWMLALRVGTQLTAAPLEVEFGSRYTYTVVALLPFLGVYSGKRGAGFLGLLLNLIVANLILRGLVVAWGYFATVEDHGTWIDLNVVDVMREPMGDGMVDFAEHSSSEKWVELIVWPQSTVFLAGGIVIGVVLGLVPWLMGKRNPDI